MYLNNVKYVNVEYLDLSNENTKDELIKLIKDCMFTFKKNQITKIKKFINNHRNIIRRASRNFIYSEYDHEESMESDIDNSDINNDNKNDINNDIDNDIDNDIIDTEDDEHMSIIKIIQFI